MCCFNMYGILIVFLPEPPDSHRFYLVKYSGVNLLCFKGLCLILHHVQSYMSQQSFSLCQASTASQIWAVLTVKSSRLKTLIRRDEKQTNCNSDNIMSTGESNAGAAEKAKKINESDKIGHNRGGEAWCLQSCGCV